LPHGCGGFRISCLDVAALRDRYIRVPQDSLYGLVGNSETVKIRRQSAPKSMPAMPPDSGFGDRRYDHVCRQRVQIDGLALWARKHQPVRRTAGQRSVPIQALSELRDDWYAELASSLAYWLWHCSDSLAASLRDRPHNPELIRIELSLPAEEEWGISAGAPKTGSENELIVTNVDRNTRTAVLRDFGDRNPQEDPVIHFYELFLKEYDAKKRMQRGVFYTPRPVVSFIVRSVDEVLRKDFKLEDGLADISTWGEMAERHRGLQIPKGISPQEPFVQILDPAVGTGTFLVEAIDVIHRTMEAKWRKQGYMSLEFQRLWNEYVPKHLLPRLYGFELMMAPYAIAHMKIGLKLFETGYGFRSDERARVYLTNSLEPATEDKDQREFKEWAPALAHEAEAVNGVKLYQRFTVIVGNPPYSGISANRNVWIEGLLRGESTIHKRAADYYCVSSDGGSLHEKKVWLKDDYVKFTRLSHFMLELSGIGIHSMITNHSYLDSPTCRGMRFQMLGFFSKMHFIDLHGSTKKREEPPNGEHDENVFDILPGVAIAVCSRIAPAAKADVKSFDLWGTRSFKSDWLLRHQLSNVKWILPGPKPPYFLFVQRNLDFDSEYQCYFSLKDIFPFYGTGIQTSRDDFAIAETREELEKRLLRFFDLTRSDREIAEDFDLSDTRGWNIHAVRRGSGFQKVKGAITKCLFRTFDLRWVALTKDIIDWPRLEVMSCIGAGKPGLLCSRQQSTSGFRHALVVDTPVDMFCISNKSREGQTLFPLFLRDSDGLLGRGQKATRHPNLGVECVKHIRTLLDHQPSDAEHELAEADVLDCFAYVYAILHSPSYRLRYADLLKMDYPRVPLPPAIGIFRALVRFGHELIQLHLLESPKLHQQATEFVGARNIQVDKVSWDRNTVWIDKAQTSGFLGVIDKVWNFHIGGYQVCEKWLKDRKGGTLSKADIEHYQKIIIAIRETIRIMADVDKAIDAHGGWPAAFATTKVKSTEAGTD
jgi:predicted helicase